MVKPSNDRVKYTVACTCGAKMSVDLRSFGHMVVCKSCGTSVKVDWGKDPRSRKKIPVAVTQVAKRAGVRPDQTPLTATCVCGYTRPVPPDSVGTPPLCPGCGKKMYVETSARKEIRLQVTPGTQAVECPCGLRLLLGPESDGREIDCPECRRRVIIEFKVFTPQTSVLAPGKTLRTGSIVRKPERTPGPGECVCACGAFIPPRTSRTGPSFTCSSCGRKGRVEVQPDPEKGTPSLRPIFDDKPASP